MIFPYKIKENISLKEKDNFNSRFFLERKSREGIWRRHQCFENKELSDWVSEKSKKRRIIHYKDNYNVIDNDFFLESSYLYHHLFLPTKECQKDINEIYSLLNKWDYIKKNIFKNGDLFLKIIKKEVFDYTCFDFIFFSKGFYISNKLKERPWNIFSLGMRPKYKKQTPQKIKIEDLEKFFPAQLELGCGPSIECGIPPLNYLHGVYNLNKENKFCFDFDFIREMIIDPEQKYKKLTKIHVSTLQAKPSNFFKNLKKLINKGLFLEDVFVNNFDGICNDFGIKEYYLRKHDLDGKYPEYKFNEKAKSLIVVGSHADRREVQKNARNKGIPIIFVDPEGYQNGINFISYPLEYTSSKDYLINLGASEFSNLTNLVYGNK